MRDLLAADLWFVDLARGGGQGPKSPPTRPSPNYFMAQPAPANLDLDLVRAAVTSSSIPVAFPPQRWTVARTFNKPGLLPVTQTGEHLLVDGGVVDNSPIDVAVTAGATHILSIELTPLFNPVLDDPSAMQPAAPRFSVLTR